MALFFGGIALLFVAAGPIPATPFAIALSPNLGIAGSSER